MSETDVVWRVVLPFASRIDLTYRSGQEALQVYVPLIGEARKVEKWSMGKCKGKGFTTTRHRRTDFFMSMRFAFPLEHLSVYKIYCHFSMIQTEPRIE